MGNKTSKTWATTQVVMGNYTGSRIEDMGNVTGKSWAGSRIEDMGNKTQVGRGQLGHK